MAARNSEAKKTEWKTADKVGDAISNCLRHNALRLQQSISPGAKTSDSGCRPASVRHVIVVKNRRIGGGKPGRIGILSLLKRLYPV